MKQLFIIICLLLGLQQTIAQYTQIPDPNFEQALIDLGIDSEGILDGQFLTLDALGINILNIDNLNINDLAGIEAFVDLTWLNAFGNNLTNVDLSLLSLTLSTLSLGNNNLTSIDLSPIQNIVNLSLVQNNFITIDASNLIHMFALYLGENPLLANVTVNNCLNLQNLGLEETYVELIDLSECPSLRNFNSRESQISSLDFTYNQNIEDVRAHTSTLTDINLPNNPNLTELWVGNTLLTALDVTNCPNLEELYCSQIGLSSLDITQNPNLEYLSSSFNQYTTLDFSQNIALKTLYMDNNLLSGHIDLSNNISLEKLGLGYNLIETVDVSNSISLDHINISRTPLTTIDLSENPNIENANFFQCQNLEFANIKNGENNSILLLFIGTQCPQLSCVVVDDPLAENDNILVDGNTTLVGSVEDCNLSISETELQDFVSVYPNPVKNRFQISTNSNLDIHKIQVLDLLGKILLDTKNTQQVNISQLPTGLLFVKIYTNKGSLVKKIIKE
ncbi:MAG: T9SS type A sorting domain-containing protein [Flavobacteriaceae bacterium]